MVQKTKQQVLLLLVLKMWALSKAFIFSNSKNKHDHNRTSIFLTTVADDPFCGIALSEARYGCEAHLIGLGFDEFCEVVAEQLSFLDVVLYRDLLLPPSLMPHLRKKSIITAFLFQQLVIKHQASAHISNDSPKGPFNNTKSPGNKSHASRYDLSLLLIKSIIPKY